MKKRTYNGPEDKRLVRDTIDDFVNKTVNRISIQNYSRTLRWANGETFREIAKGEKVTAATVGFGVKRTVELIKEFAALKTSE